jgi:translation initiation factor IF-2
MSESTTPRLMAAAKEFNIGKDTLVDFLIGKGFSKDDLKPTSKLTEDMYRSLQQEFQGDKVAKIKSDQIDLPKGGSTENRKKKDEEDLGFKKEITKKPVKEVKPVEEVKALPVELPKAEEPSVVVSKVEAPEVESPKVFDKIDLSTIDSSTRPKKGIKKKEEAVSETPKPVEKKTKEIIKEDAPVVMPEKTVEPEEIQAPVIENIRAEKLEGPKIFGKIELPVDSDTRPKQNDEKRKRKRIPIDKKGETPVARQGGQQGSGGGGGFQRGGFSGGQQQNRGGGQQQGGGGQGQGGGFRRGGTGGQQPNRGGTGGSRGPISREVKEIDKKEIQDKIRETQAKLAGTGGRGKSSKSKIRREKRQEMAEQGDQVQDNKLLRISQPDEC